MSADKKKKSCVRALSRPLVLLGVLLFVSIFMMLGSLLYVGNKRADQQQHVKLVSEQLLLSQRMATYALGASAGKESDFENLLENSYRFSDILNVFRSGDTAMGTPPLDEGLMEPLDSVEASWSDFNSDLSIILKGKKPISEVR